MNIHIHTGMHTHTHRSIPAHPYVHIYPVTKTNRERQRETEQKREAERGRERERERESSHGMPYAVHILYIQLQTLASSKESEECARQTDTSTIEYDYLPQQIMLAWMATNRRSSGVPVTCGHARSDFQPCGRFRSPRGKSR